MADTLDTARPAAVDDLSALAWVHAELRRSLESAHKALRRHLKESEAAAGSDVDAVDPAVLRTARSQLHQGVGALELVGLPAMAEVLRASEAVVQRMVTRPAMADLAAVEKVEQVSFALLDFLGRQLVGKPVSPLLLFPQYRAARQLAGADRIHPADLWKIDWQWLEPPPDASAQARSADDAARGDMETLVLALMRDPSRSALARMSDLCADLAAGARLDAGAAPLHGAAGTRLATFWQLAAAVFEAQASGLLAGDVYTKRIASRMLAQLRLSARGRDELSDRLAQDLLFFCSHARPPSASHPAPRLEAVRQTWRLEEHPSADYESVRLGLFDPAHVSQARKRVAAAKDTWSAVAGGELHRSMNLAEQFALVGDSLKRLFPSGDTLAEALSTAVAQTVAARAEPPPALAMEVATGMLYLDASLEDGELDHPELGARIRHLARRVDEVRIGADQQPLEAWMEELYRRVSDRQTMGSVVQELRASLSEVEKQIDQYFRNPSEREVLIPVPAQLSSMRGVLSVLGLEQASHAVVHMRDAVDALAQTEVDPQQAIQAGTFDRLADNLGALSFLIDMLSVQPGLAKSLFRFDPETGGLSAVMGQPERVSAFADLQEAPAPVAAPSPPPLQDLVTALAAAAARRDVGNDEIAARTERLAQQALAAEQPELARLLGAAQSALLRGADDNALQAVRDELARALTALATAGPEAVPVPPTSPAVRGGSGLEDDADEVRGIFIEEAREVIAGAREALERLADAPDNADEMTTLRRAFHTLKGSARMVDLPEYGEAAWACEQLYNARLAQAPRMEPSLRSFSDEALNYLGDWVDAIAAGRDGGHDAAAVAVAADAMRLRGQRLGIAAAEPRGQGDERQLQDRVEQAPAPAAGVAIAQGAAPSAGAETGLPPAVDEAEPPAAREPAGETVPPFDAETPTEVIVMPASASASAAPAAAEPEFESEPGFDAGLGLDAAPVGEPAPFDAPALPAGVLDFEFGLSDEAPAAASPDADATLVQRVPDLPSAADLDLGLPAQGRVPPAEPQPEQAAASAEQPFMLDLGNLEALSASAPYQVPPSPTAPADGVSPDFVLDLPLEAPADDVEAAGTGFAERDLDAGGLLPAEAAEAPVWPPAMEPSAPPGEPPRPALPDLDLAALEDAVGREDAPTEVLPVGEVVAEAVWSPAEAGPEAAPEPPDEQVKVIGPLRIGIPLFNIYLNEADELSRRLGTELAEWALEYERHPVPETSVALAHSLAGSSATVGYAELSVLARALEHALMRSHAGGPGCAGEPELFNEAADEIRRLLHQFAAGFLRPVAPELMERLAAHERLPVAPIEAASSTAVPSDAVPGVGAGDIELDLGTVDAPVAPVAPEGPDAPPAPPREPWFEPPFEPAPAAAPGAISASAGDFDDDAGIDADDATDAELFPIFEEEAEELLPQLQMRLRDWLDKPGAIDAPAACLRTLHTFKGGARLSGAMRLGEMAHRLETAIERLAAAGPASAADVEPLLGRADAMLAAFDALRKAGPAKPPALAPAPEPAAPEMPESGPSPAAGAVGPPPIEPTVEPATGPPPVLSAQPPAETLRPGSAMPAATGIDWSRFAALDAVAPLPMADRPAAGAAPGAVVRVRAALLDRLVNEAGEVSITRARIDADVRQLQGWLAELTDSLDRMRRQLRDIEVQAETQISSRIEAAKAAAAGFDPLEMDRFTRFQELTRFMAESVNDVATLQRSLQRTLQSAEDELAAQARLTRELQDDLLRTRMVEFESMSDRFYRTVRQAAKDAGKPVRLDIEGGAIEIDRGVLERMTGPFEHLLRNAVAHGIEPPPLRRQAGKDEVGRITIAVAQAGNEVAVEIADDGAGLDLGRIRQRGIERGLIAADAPASDAELAQLIFSPGFSTSDRVTELAGRGVGMDVVRAEVGAMGGRVETASSAGHGTRFKLLLPLTTAVTQVVILRCGELKVAVPSTLIEVVRRLSSAEVERAYAEGTIDQAGEAAPFFWLAALLEAGTRGGSEGRAQAVVVVRSAGQRVAVHVDEVVGNQEVVVKHIGPQLARLPGLAGVTLLPSGAVALIYNPVALASVHAASARARMLAGGGGGEAPVAAVQAARPPMVMVVDDSLTVRRVTQRLLEREGWRVVTAKDGLDALERLAEERPLLLLSDIEMPRMDGFDLVRNVRADARLADLPVVMITSRIAQKHRDYAAELGVQHYLGKPYAEEELLSLVARYAGAAAPDIPA